MLLSLFVSNLFHALVVFLRLHNYLFFAQLDPVKDIAAYGVTLETATREASQAGHQTPGRRRLNWGYLLPFLEASFLIIDTAVIFIQADFKYSLTEMPQLFTHLIFPPEFYPVGDPMIFLAIVMSFAVSGCLLIDPMLERKYHMYLMVDQKTGKVKVWQDGKVFPTSVSSKLYSFRRRAGIFNPSFILTGFFIVEEFFLYNFSSNWSGSLRDYLMLFIILTYFTYGTFCNMFTVSFYHMTVMYLRFKQDYLNEEVIKLTNQIKEKIEKSPPKGPVKSKRNRAFYRAFQRLNSAILSLYGEIEGHNRFWSKYLTLYMFHYITEICILSYGAIFIDSHLGLHRTFFIVFSVEFVVFLCAISYASSMVVYRNIGLHKSCITFCRLIQKIVPFGTGDLLKFNGMASSLKSIPSIGFTLLNQYRVNSQLFQMVVTYISITYMYLITMLRQ